VHAAQWDDERTAVHAARVHPTAPLPEDWLSSAGQLAIVIEEWLRHGQFHPGYFALTAQGDGHRVFHQGDVGTEKVTLGLLRRVRQRVLAAVVDDSDARSAKYETEAAARAAVNVLAARADLAALAVPDHLHAPLHNGMALVKQGLEVRNHAAMPRLQRGLSGALAKVYAVAGSREHPPPSTSLLGGGGPAGIAGRSRSVTRRVGGC